MLLDVMSVLPPPRRQNLVSNYVVATIDAAKA